MTSTRRHARLVRRAFKPVEMAPRSGVMRTRTLLLAVILVISTVISACLPPQAAQTHVSPIDVTRVPKTGQIAFFANQQSAIWKASDFQITFTDGRNRRTVTSRDFIDSAFAGNKEAGMFETAQTGTLSLQATLLAADGSELTRGSLDLPLRRDWYYSVWFAIQEQDPCIGAFGCGGSTSFPVDARLGLSGEDRFWIYWGGNSISSPVVY